MKPETQEAFKNVIEAILKDRTLYNLYDRTYSRDGDKFTVLGLDDIACNHLFDDRPELFGITKQQGHNIREYFHNNNPEVIINELYRLFPNIFEGESKKYVDNSKVDKDIPLF